MTLTSKHKLLIGIGIVVVAALALYFTQDLWKPLPDNTTYHDSAFSFEYPRSFSAEEYAPNAVGISSVNENGTTPLVQVIRYQSDPDSALPASFDAYVERQALALCGSDGPVEDLSCSDLVRTPYTSAQGHEGQELSLTLLRTNLESGTTTTETFAPLYVFNATRPVEDPEDKLRYRALFVYPAFSSVVGGNTSPELLAQVIDSLVIPNGVSTTTAR
ncbi:MAG TPA: hypothetical protein PK609_03945 [Candidatus Paceibacterota bacterium]|nr:hypothetical protein [Candidatus Paceibacterota bacterium]